MLLVRLEDLDLTATLYVDHPAVGGHRERHRVDGVAVEGPLLEVAPDGAAAVTRLVAGGPLHAAEDVVAEVGLAVGLARVSHGRGPDPATAGVTAPGDRMVGAHRPGARVVRAFVGGDQDVHLTARVLVEVVPLLAAVPSVRQAGRRRVLLVGDDGGAGQDAGGVLRHVGTRVDGLVPPRVLALDAHVGGVVDGHDALAAGEVALHRLALAGRRPHHAGRLEHDQHIEGGEIGCREDTGVLTVHQLEVVGRSLLLEHRDPGRDRVVPVAGGLGENRARKAGAADAGWTSAIASTRPVISPMMAVFRRMPSPRRGGANRGATTSQVTPRGASADARRDGGRVRLSHGLGVPERRRRPLRRVTFGWSPAPGGKGPR